MADTDLTLELVASVEEVDRDEWARLARGASVYGSWAWYRSLEEDEHFTPQYLLVRSGRVLRGALPTYSTHGGGNPFYAPGTKFDSFFARLASPLRWTPGLAAGSRAAYLTHLLLHPDAGAAVLRKLVDGLFRLSQTTRGEGVRARWMFYVPEPDAAVVASVMPRGTIVLYGGADQRLAIEWASFDDYLSSLGSKRRYAARRELRVFRESGATIGVGGLRELAPQLAPLFAQTQTRYGRPTDAAWAEDFLYRQAEMLDSCSRAFLCSRDGRPIGFSLFYVHERVLHARLVGFDYAFLEAFEYFSTLFYEPIRYAIEGGFESIHYGIESYDAKLGRGARPSPLWCFLHNAEIDLSELEDDAERWNAEQMAEFVSRYRRFFGEATSFRPAAGPRPVQCREG